ncbi:MAG: type IV pilin protein [Betaproteobacteria bacterium]|nr:type IV pilin protein [Betaproteobacteria bacterium]
MNAAGRLERQYSVTNRYPMVAEIPSLMDVANLTGCPNGTVANSNPSPFYIITYSNPDSTNQSFLITATAQTLGDQDQDKCGNLTMDHIGQKTASKGDSSLCWR